MRELLKPVITLLVLVPLILTVEAQQMDRTASPPGARVYIASPANGEVVPTTFNVEFGLAGMGVAPAGVMRANTGHHHLLVDGQELPSMTGPLGDVVAHFGGGQTQTRLTLPPGEHTLQLIFADHLHTPHNPPVVSEVVTVVVVAD